MRSLSIFLVVILIAFMPQKKTRVLFFGDSITQLGTDKGGYIQRIDSLCRLAGMESSYEFIGAGISGNKIYDLFLRMDSDVIAKSPDIVFIYIGVNDVWHKKLTGTGTDRDRFEKFYQAIIDKLKSKGISPVLCTPAVIGEKTDFSNEQDGDLNAYSNLIRIIAERNKTPLVDLRKAFLDYNLKNNVSNKESGILTRDRVHLNAAGNQLVADSMWRKICEMTGK
jgi:lysophospholipase L1-like esterase